MTTTNGERAQAILYAVKSGAYATRNVQQVLDDVRRETVEECARRLNELADDSDAQGLTAAAVLDQVRELIAEWRPGICKHCGRPEWPTPGGIPHGSPGGFEHPFEPEEPKAEPAKTPVDPMCTCGLERSHYLHSVPVHLGGHTFEPEEPGHG